MSGSLSSIHYYESLGTPIVLYRHTGDENVGILETNPSAISLASDTYDSHPLHVKTLIASSLRNPAIEAVDSTYPPQPWGRIPPFYMNGSRSVRCDANTLLQADRARTRYYLTGLLESFVKSQRKKTSKAMRKPFGVMMTQTPERIASVFNEQHPEYHVDLRSPYVQNINDRKSKLLPLLPTIFARNLRRDVRFSSPKDGYCAPFPPSVIRYCSTTNESEDLPFPQINKPTNKIIDATDLNSKDDKINDLDTFDRGPETFDSQQIEDDTESDGTESTPTNFLSHNDETDLDEGMRTITKEIKIKSRGKYPFRSKVIRPFPKPRGPCFSPQYYGNCLVVLPCPCDMNEIESNKCHGWFLVHTRGTCVAITRINLPQSKLTAPISSSIPIINVGDSILQITQCFDVDNPLSNNNKWPSDHFPSWRFAARTSRNIVILSLESSGEHSAELCSVSFTLKHINRIDLPTVGDALYIPITLAARVDDPHASVHRYSTFATVSSVSLNSPYDESMTNVIHHIIEDGRSSGAQIKRHEIKRLHSISLVEFSRFHPMVLWSASRSQGVSPFFEGPYLSKLPTIGYGHSIYSIDLRSNDAALSWSPSRTEFSLERVHSISGILPDACNQYHLYVSSISTGKTFKIDCRMNSRSICSWTLPGLCDDYKPTGTNAGVYGFGTVMTKPVIGLANNTFDRQCLPLLTATKTPGSFGFHVLQEPASAALPRFATQCLEIPACPDGSLDCQHSFATSSTFKIAGSSSGIFTTGITAFYTPISSLMDDRSIVDLGYVPRSPNRCLCVITANSIGDIFGYTLLQNGNDVQKRSVRFDDLPVGTSAVPVPSAASLSDGIDRNHSNGFLWYLSNKYPTSSDAIMKEYTDKKSHCRPFTSIDRHLLNKSMPYHRSRSTSDYLSLHHHTFNETYIGEEGIGFPPTVLKLPAEYCCGESLNISRYSSSTAGETKTADASGRCDLKDDTIASLRSLW